MAAENVPFSLGEAIRYQRELAQLPLRQLAEMVGISNPYLSQIERGLREPSEQVLDAIADSLHTTADALVGRPVEEEDEPAVLAAIRADRRLTATQRQALSEIYLSCVTATVARRKRRGGH